MKVQAWLFTGISTAVTIISLLTSLTIGRLNTVDQGSHGTRAFTVVPDSESGKAYCKGREPCGTLDYFVSLSNISGPGIFSSPHTVWVFRPGEHSLRSDILIENAQNVTLTGDTECEQDTSLCTLVLETTVQDTGNALALKAARLEFLSSKGITISYLYLTTMILARETISVCETGAQTSNVESVSFANVSNVVLHKVSFDFWDLGTEYEFTSNPYSIVIASPSGNYKVTRCAFQGMRTVSIAVNANPFPNSEHHLQSSSFSLSVTESSFSKFGQLAIAVHTSSADIATDVLIQFCNFTSGKALDTLHSLVLVEVSGTFTNKRLKMSNSQFYNNAVPYPVLTVNYSNAFTCTNCSDSGNAPVQITDCIFTNNSGGVDIAMTESPRTYTYSCTKSTFASVTNTIFTSNNVAGHTFTASLSKLRHEPNSMVTTLPCPPLIHFSDVLFASNAHTATAFNAASIDGIVYFGSVHIRFTGQTRIVSNSGCGLQLSNSRLAVSGRTEINGNSGGLPNSCGGVHMNEASLLVLASNSVLSISQNRAPILGGGIHIGPNSLSRQVGWNPMARSDCFVTHFDRDEDNDGNTPGSPIQARDTGRSNATLLVYKNYAQFGTDIYSSYKYNCSDMIYSRDHGDSGLKDDFTAFWVTAGTNERKWYSMASQPFQICLCEHGNQNISNCNQTEQDSVHQKLYPGEVWQLMVSVLGMFGNTLETDVYIAINDGTASADSVWVRTKQCTGVLTIDPDLNSKRLHTAAGSNGSSRFSITLTAPPMYPDSAILPEDFFLKRSLMVNLIVTDCPPGMQVHRTANSTFCTCNALLQEHDFECTVTDSVVKYKSRRQSYWIALQGDDESVILSDYCPVEYCTNVLQIEGVTLDDLTTTGNSKQCIARHQGLLCSQDVDCDHRLYTQTVVLLLCGILTVAVLLFLNASLRNGTLNGFSMYANILILMTRYKTLKPLAGVASFMNLEFNIGACSVSTDSSHVDEWAVLQTAFPLCCVVGIELLLVILLLAVNWCCVKNVTVNAYLKDRAVPVLALTVLLTFTNVLRAIISVLSHTTVYTSSTDYTMRWVRLPQFVYFTGGHLGVAILSIVLIVTYVLPFILVVTTADCLKLLVTFKFLFNAFRGPFQGLFGFWLGMRVILRVILTLVGYFSSERTFAIIVLMTLLFSVFLQLLLKPFRNTINLDEPHKITNTTNLCSPRDAIQDLVLKFFHPQTLDHLFFLNMIGATISIIAHAQAKAVFIVFCVSVSLALLQLLAILIFHCHQRVSVIANEYRQRKKRVESVRLSSLTTSTQDNGDGENPATDIIPEHTHGNSLGAPLLLTSDQTTM